MLSQSLREEADALVLRSVLFGLGRFGLAKAVSLVATFAKTPSPDLRYAATHALLPFHSDPQAFRLLLDLCDDVDHDVRNWALFAVGWMSELDTPEIRDMLTRHLVDRFPDAREEAIAGLAKRDDVRAIAPLQRLLRSSGYHAHHTWDFAVLAGIREGTESPGPEALLTALEHRLNVVQARDEQR